MHLTPVIGIWIVLSGVSFGQSKFEDPPHWNADRKDNFFQHGAFKQTDDNGIPIGWDAAAFESGYAKVLKDSKGIVQLTCPTAGIELEVSTIVNLPKKAEYVTILTRMRGPTIKLGSSEQSGAGMVYSLIAADGSVREFPRVEPIYQYGSLGGWKTYRSTLRVRPSEQKLTVRAVVFDATGSLEVDRVIIVASKPGYQPKAGEVEKMLRAIQKDDRFTIARMIAKTPQLLEVRTGFMENGTPLIWASWYNSKNVAEELLQSGADMEVSDESWQNTPLAWCCWWGNAEVAEVLIKAGAEIKNYERMAASSKNNNKSPRGSAEDFDKIVQLIEEAKKKTAAKTTTEPAPKK